jgi:hypothetical protein
VIVLPHVVPPVVVPLASSIDVPALVVVLSSELHAATNSSMAAISGIARRGNRAACVELDIVGGCSLREATRVASGDVGTVRQGHSARMSIEIRDHYRNLDQLLRDTRGVQVSGRGRRPS